MPAWQAAGPMITAAHASLMARYNAWMNSRIYVLCDDIPATALHEDCGAFFGSIHRTLEHILVSDRSFLSWFSDEGLPTIDAAQGFATFETLRQTRLAIDARLCHWAGTLVPDDLARAITYKSGLDGRSRTVPKWALVTHMFNHQAHHRGQVTTLLSQRGVDIGSTDLPSLAEFDSV